MSTTLEPVLQALGYTSPAQQRDMIKLLQASGAFGDLPGVKGVLDDKQALTVLQHVTFDDAAAAAAWLRKAALENMRRPPNIERFACEDTPYQQQNRAELLSALHTIGLLSEGKPTRKHFDHVLVLGGMEGSVTTRLDLLKQLWDDGIRFDKIHLLGCERPLDPQYEPIANIGVAGGEKLSNEMQMMQAHYYERSACWPQEMQNVRIFAVNTFDKENYQRANTRDTIKSWVKANPTPGSVLVLSNQPHVAEQHEAVLAELPPSFQAETVGARISDENLKINVAMDAIAHQIDIAFPRLTESLKSQDTSLKTPIVMLDPKTIRVDAATYQFRAGGDNATGVTAKGRFKAERWDPIIHGDPLLVHQRKDRSYYVADGHHRLDLAKELNTKGTGPGQLAAMVLREADGYTAQDVKIIAAYKNIAHGQTDAVDTARVFKEAESGSVHTNLLPKLQMEKGNLRLYHRMSKLSNKALDEVAKGHVPAEMAAQVAERVPEACKQEEVVRIISDKLHQKYNPDTRGYDTHLQVHAGSMNGDTNPKEKSWADSVSCGCKDKTNPSFVNKLENQPGPGAGKTI